MRTGNGKLVPHRNEYNLSSLDEKDVYANPFEQFHRWFSDVLKLNITEPNAVVLSTCSQSGTPSSRVVLLKSVERDGFVFFTNYHSRKAEELNENPNASLLFFWKELERQIRIEGKVKKTSRKYSAEYFRSRPIESQLGAWVSKQSMVLESRQELDSTYANFSNQMDGKPVKLPNFWGGYLLRPIYFEFWQGRKNRLHDRIVYTKNRNGWNINRLWP